MESTWHSIPKLESGAHARPMHLQLHASASHPWPQTPCPVLHSGHAHGHSALQSVLHSGYVHTHGCSALHCAWHTGVVDITLSTASHCQWHNLAAAFRLLSWHRHLIHPLLPRLPVLTLPCPPMLTPLLFLATRECVCLAFPC